MAKGQAEKGNMPPMEITCAGRPKEARNPPGMADLPGQQTPGNPLIV